MGRQRSEFEGLEANRAVLAVIFIDEVDVLFRERSRSDHEVTGMMCVPLASNQWAGLTHLSTTGKQSL